MIVVYEVNDNKEHKRKSGNYLHERKLLWLTRAKTNSGKFSQRMDHYRNKMRYRIEHTCFVSKCMERKNNVANRKQRYEKVEVVEQVNIDIVIQP